MSDIDKVIANISISPL